MTEVKKTKKTEIGKTKLSDVEVAFAKRTKMNALMKVKRTTLVNLRTYRGTDYVLIDRRTIFGNPHRMGTYSPVLKRRLTRADAVGLFRVTFVRRMKSEPAYRVRVEGLRGLKLACWCTPLGCHGDVYVEYLDEGRW